MMFREMSTAQLYPPQYTQNTERAVESVTVTLFNLERPTVWDEVSDWIDRNGPISNGQLREIAKVDIAAASLMLRDWVQQGLLASLPDRGRRNAAYAKVAAPRAGDLFVNGENNNAADA